MAKATVQQTTAVINSQDVLKEVLRLADTRKNRQQRTCPTYLDNYQCYDDAFGAPNNPLGGYDSSVDPDNVANGAYPGLTFTAVDGTPFGPFSASTLVTPAVGSPYNVTNGVPVSSADQAGYTTYTLYMQLTSTEPLVLSPFVFADAHEWSTGLFGINNIQLVMNLQSDIRRIIRTTSRTNRAFSLIGFSQGISSSPWARAVVNCQFLTPALSIPLPPKSVIDYYEFPRYISQNGNSSGSGQTVNPGQTVQLQSQTITLPTIPDLLIIYVKAAQSANTSFVSSGGLLANNYADFYLPLASSQTIGGGSVNPVSIQFDNFSGRAVMAF